MSFACSESMVVGPLSSRRSDLALEVAFATSPLKQATGNCMEKGGYQVSPIRAVSRPDGESGSRNEGVAFSPSVFNLRQFFSSTTAVVQPMKL